MAEDLEITSAFRQLADKEEDDVGGETIVLDEMDLMATTEFKRFITPPQDPAGDAEAGDDPDGEKP